MTKIKRRGDLRIAVAEEEASRTNEKRSQNEIEDETVRLKLVTRTLDFLVPPPDSFGIVCCTGSW